MTDTKRLCFCGVANLAMALLLTASSTGTATGAEPAKLKKVPPAPAAKQAKPQKQKKEAKPAPAPVQEQATPAPALEPSAAAPSADVQPTSLSLVEQLAARVSAASQANPGAASSVLTAQDTATSAPVSTGALLEQAPSVNLRRTSALNLDPRVRGYQSSQINASANGATQLKTRIDIDSLFSHIDPGIVSDLTVIDGPYSSLYGPGFAFLVAELFATQRYQCGPEMHGSSIFAAGTNGRSLYARQNAWGGGAKWGMYASLGKRTGNDYRAGGDADYRMPASYDKWDGFVSLGYDLSCRSRVEFNYLRTEVNDTELPGVVYDIRNSRNDQFNVRYVMQEDREGPEQVVLQYWWNRTPYYGDSLNESKHNSFYDNFITAPFGGTYQETYSYGALQSTGLRALMTWGDADSIRPTLGVDWRRQEMTYREVDPPATTVYGIPHSSQDDFGLFTNLVAPITDYFTVTIGSRIDAVRSYADDDVVAAGNGANNDTLGMAYLTTKLRLTEPLSLNAGVGYGMRSANLTELYANAPFVPLVRFGNSYLWGDEDLEPERNLQFDLGLKGEWENVTASVRGFHSSIDDYILYTLAGLNAGGGVASYRYVATNLERATLYGGDASAEVRLLRWLAVNGSITFVEGINHSPTTSFAATAGEQESLPNIYPLNGRIGIRVFEPCNGRWSLEFIARMVKGQEYLASTLDEIGTPGFTVFGLRGYFQVNDNVRLTSSIENLFDRNYTEHGSLAITGPTGGGYTFVKEPGFNWLTGVEVTY